MGSECRLAKDDHKAHSTDMMLGGLSGTGGGGKGSNTALRNEWIPNTPDIILLVLPCPNKSLSQKLLIQVIMCHIYVICHTSNKILVLRYGNQ